MERIELPLIQYPFTEIEILDLQEKFLSEGIHQLKVHDIPAGRQIIHTFLESLPIYHETACLTVAQNPLESYIINIYHDLLLHGYINRFESKNLEEFFIDQFYFDFLWIECTPRLMNQPWFTDFQMSLLNFRLDRHLPILMVFYEQD